YSDWIEIYNPGDSPVDLTGYGLSDRSDNPFKWVFPSFSLGSGEYIILFTSGKDRTKIINSWETIMWEGDDWQYFVGTEEPPSNWKDIGFNGGWQTGTSGFGYGDGNEATTIPSTASLYIRKTFTVDNLTDIVRCYLHMDYDDAFVAYINGTEVARSNIGEVGTPPPFDQYADGSREGEMHQGGDPEEFEIVDIQSILIQGENVLAVQVHNLTILSSDLAAIPFLTFGATTPISNPRGTPDFINYLATILHSNFKISSSGETLLLTDKSGNLCDLIDTEYIPIDLSRGRTTDGGAEWGFFSQPTPGESNSSQSLMDFASPVQMSLPGGFYDNILTVELSAASEDAVIRYTLDGSEPTEESNKYTDAITLYITRVVRARSFKSGCLPGKINTNTYFINREFTLPVISLSTDPDNLFDDDIGIYENLLRVHLRWEQPIHVEFYEQDGSLGFSIDGAIKLFGKSAIVMPQKSLTIFAREKYGFSEINYQIFPDLPISKFKSIILRNGGHEFSKTHFRDSVVQSLFTDMDVDIQAYRPCATYINGKYWGIYNIREKLNEDYVASHHGVDPNNIDMIQPYWRVASEDHQTDERGTILVEGDKVHYYAMWDYLENHDLKIDAHYEYIKTQIDVKSYIDYLIAEMYCDNKDWLANNMKQWRPRTPDGKWRYMPYDLDFALGGEHALGFDRGYGDNILKFVTDFPRASPYQDWTNFIIRKMLDNESFKNDFINRFADCMNSNFSADVVLQKISKFEKEYEQEMPYHIARWKDENLPSWANPRLTSMAQWYNNVKVMEDFTKIRADRVRTHIIQKFNLSGTARVDLNVSQADRGKIKINTLTVNEYPWNGTYFMDVPVQVTALPNPGYEFTGWTGATTGDSITSTVYLTSDLSVTANFEKFTGASSTIVINEINYNSSANFNPEDWVELYNPQENPVDLSGWVFKDDANEFVFPSNTVITPDDYLVLCRDSLAFHELFPEVYNYIGDLDFGLSGGSELIKIFNAQGALVDSLTYDDNPPWPQGADGNGYTLSLLGPSLNNALGVNWVTTVKHGTPGYYNLEVQNSSVVINEINYNSSTDFDPEDWVELYNPQENSVDLSGWVFKDENDANEFVFPANIVIGPDDYLVLCRIKSAFYELFPETDNYIGDLGFGFSGTGEFIRLFNAQEEIVDSLTYDVNLPWPEEPDGEGYTLSLRHPGLDNSHPDNWVTSVMHGTPGEINYILTGVDETVQSNFPAVFSLRQNYPNPFNPVTTIEFSLPESGYVTLVIYNMMGQKVRELVAENMQAGAHSVIWDGKDDNGYDISSGVYISRLKSKENGATVRMLLMK
ncbi:lamin tail domain-containing protein, partial [Candidatus Latescibacterota bacterium]